MFVVRFFKKLWAYKVVRFFCVGIINTVTDIIILDILHFAFGVPVLIGNLFSASISITLSYFLNHILVFRSTEQRTLKLYLKFFAITGVSLLISQSIILTVLIHIFTIHRLYTIFGLTNPSAAIRFAIRLLQVDGAKIVAVMVGMIWNYVLYHMIVFREPKTEKMVETEQESSLPY